MDEQEARGIIEQAKKAIRCLYIAVEEPVAKDVDAKVSKAIALARRSIGWVAVSERMPTESPSKPRVWAFRGIPAALGAFNREMAERHGYTHWYEFPDPPAGE